MKRTYVKPVFIADTYEVNTSIATCQFNIHTDPLAVAGLTLNKGDAYLCPVGDSGHAYGGQNGSKGALVEAGINSITLFTNDNANCNYVWDGRGEITNRASGTSYGSFGNAIYGAETSNENHRPAYQKSVFVS